jgi:Flp pilus assembly protein TadD
VNLKNVSAATGCDTLMSGEITDRQTRFWGVYSEVKIGANITITRVSTGSVIWRGKHTAVVRDGGLPINPISIIGGSISAGMNLRDEQVIRTTNDLARRLVTAIPHLRFRDKDSDLFASPSVLPLVNDSSASAHGFIASIEDRPTAELVRILSAALMDKRWSDPKDTLVLSDYLLKKDPNNIQAMVVNATARLENSQPEESLAMVNRAIAVEGNNPKSQFLKGRALLQLNKPAEATEPLLKAAGSDNPQAVYFTALGLAYNQLGRHEFALASLTRSLQLEPDKPYVLIQQAIAYVGAGEEAEAAVALKKCMVLSIIANDPRNAKRALSIFKSMDLSDHTTSEELMAYEIKINSLLTTP